MNSVELKEVLRDPNILGILTDQELYQLAERLKPIHYSLGQTVVSVGEEADAFFIVYSGRARVIAIGKKGEEITVGTLTRGDWFGEQGLLTNLQRNQTVRAASDLSVLRLNKDDFDDLLEKHPSLREFLKQYISDLSLKNFLKVSTAFAPLSPGEISDLSHSIKLIEYEPEKTIIREGDAADAFFVMRTGAARVIKESNDGQVINSLAAGDAFGELALLTGQPRSASIVTTEASSVLRLGKADFDRIISASPKFKASIASIAAGYGKLETRDDFISHQLAEETRITQVNDHSVYTPRRKRRYPSLLQVSETDCGAACLSMILKFFGKHVSINKLRELANVGRDGSSLKSIAEAAEKLGFVTRGLKTSYDRLERVELPAIVHWQGFHFVVLYEVTRDRVILSDPAIGLRKISRAQFEKEWTGYLLLLTPTAQIETVEESKTTRSRFLPLLRPHVAVLAEIFLASLMLQFFGLALPIFTQLIVDNVLVHKSTSMLNGLLVGMLCIAIFQTTTTALRYYLLVHTTRRIDMQMVVAFYRHIFSLPLRYFEERKVGDILKRFNENARIRNFLTGRVLGVTLDCLMIFVYLALMFYYSVKLSVAAVVFIPGYIALTLIVTPIFKRQFREAFEKSADADSQIVESISGVGAIKAQASERTFRWKLEGLIAKSLNVQFRSALSGMATISIGNMLQTLNTIVLFWYGAHLVINDELSIGQLIAFNVLVSSVTRPILSVVDLWREFQEINIAFERLNDVFDSKPEEEAGAQNRISLPRIHGRLKFENVTFRYPTRADKNALQNVTLEIQPGQTVALVGRSGAGKTTFANLLLRLHEPNEGNIFVDDHDLRHVSISSLRSQIGVVPQDISLFSGTIRENISFGEPDAPLEQIIGAAMLAGAHDFITELPLGYETRIGERGQTLSGGQKQRLAIARALFKKPRILIFDEATSALDTESEGVIQRNLDQILKDRTTIIIAHRLSTVRKADVIIVMDRGTVREIGNHDDLMAQKGLYYYLNSQQLEG